MASLLAVLAAAASAGFGCVPARTSDGEAGERGRECRPYDELMSEELRIETLSEQECWELLDSVRFGRVALAPLGEPDIFPVNFLAADGTILLRTGPGTKLTEMLVNSAVAVEADGVGEASAWSVVAKGTAKIVTKFDEIYADDERHLETWLPTDKPVYVEIAVTALDGRRFHR